VQVAGDAHRQVAEQRPVVFGEGHAGDDRQLRGGFPRGGQRFQDFQAVGEGLQQDGIRAGPGQRRDLLAEGGAGVLRADAAVGPQAHAERPDRAGDVKLRSGGLGGGPPRQGDARRIDGPDLRLQAEAGQLVAVGAEGVGLEQLRAGRQKAGVNGGDQLRAAQVQFIKAGVDGDAVLVQGGAHRAVGQDRGAGSEAFAKGSGGHVLWLPVQQATAKCGGSVTAPPGRAGVTACRGRAG